MKSELEKIAEIQKLRELKSLSDLAACERRIEELSAAKAHLQDLKQELRQVDDELVPMKSVGADSLWNAWLDQAKKKVDYELAKAYSEKAQLGQIASLAVARSTVADKIYLLTASERKSLLEKRKLNKMLEDSPRHAGK